MGPRHKILKNKTIVENNLIVHNMINGNLQKNSSQTDIELKVITIIISSRQLNENKRI